MKVVVTVRFESFINRFIVRWTNPLTNRVTNSLAVRRLTSMRVSCKLNGISDALPLAEISNYYIRLESKMAKTKEVLLLRIFEGYVRNYRRLNLFQATNSSMFTKREIEYFATVGEYLGFFSFIEDTKPNHDYGRSRPMDLSWWKWDETLDSERFSNLVLHLERENLSKKDMETIDKLFCSTDAEYIPDYVIGILNVENKERINILQSEVRSKNKNQKSETLMIYMYYDDKEDFERIEAHYLSGTLKHNVIVYAISHIDNTGYWTMCLEEEYKA